MELYTDRLFIFAHKIVSFLWKNGKKVKNPEFLYLWSFLIKKRDNFVFKTQKKSKKDKKPVLCLHMNFARQIYSMNNLGYEIHYIQAWSMYDTIKYCGEKLYVRLYNEE